MSDSLPSPSLCCKAMHSNRRGENKPKPPFRSSFLYASSLNADFLRNKIQQDSPSSFFWSEQVTVTCSDKKILKMNLTEFCFLNTALVQFLMSLGFFKDHSELQPKVYTNQTLWLVTHEEQSESYQHSTLALAKTSKVLWLSPPVITFSLYAYQIFTT